MRSLGPRLLLLLLVALAAVLPYAGAHRNGFVYDDVVAVRDNPRVHGLAHARELFTTEYWNRPELPSRLYRPLTLLAIAAEWAWLGSEPGHFHVTNLVLHGLVSVAVTLLVLGALARRGPPSDDEEEEARDRRSSAGRRRGRTALRDAPLHSEAVLDRGARRTPGGALHLPDTACSDSWREASRRRCGDGAPRSPRQGERDPGGALSRSRLARLERGER
ncbi:MAG: hypothetical protein U0527_12765 [Candidatus Eisenbacteria bacterium]